ncbi:MAG: excinuclease ABC subunit UvrC [Elusimicrobiota bacterium]|nr:excinuclease ABC subunit UvrC [Elusimicrobiota bacterium]
MAEFENLPESPGVYLFLDSAHRVIYTGKANSIKKRVRQHFGKKNLDSRRLAMITKVQSVNYIKTRTEREALLLEEKMIKNIRPRYNIALKDDKSYPYLELTMGGDFPALKITRNRKNKDSIYFGPFPNVGDIKDAKKIVEDIFPLRKCKKFRLRKRPCLNYQIERCLSPCTCKVTKKEYSGIVKEVKLFLSGREDKLTARLEKKMEEYKNKREYEKAAAVRDRIQALENLFPRVSYRSITRKNLEALEKIDPLYVLKEKLDMDFKPVTIEGYDISHISSKQAVGSKVLFVDGRPEKSGYRRYKIKQKETSDDIKMLEEVIYRRLRRVKEEQDDPPDIMLIDGGKGQLSAACRMRDKFSLSSVRVLSLAKKKGRIYYRDRMLDIKKESPAYNLIKKIDDEAHRFAVSYHRLRRRKNMDIV